MKNIHVTAASPVLDHTLGEVLYSSGKTEVYRAIQEETQHAVVIKVLASEYPGVGDLVQFRNQYAIARHLSHPGIVTPTALEEHGNGYALIMPDEGLISLATYWNHRDETLDTVFDIALQLTDILHYLIGQRVIHKDIKPANILIHPDTGQVQLIDFSIASLLPKERQEMTSPNVLEGTLAYLSPEQTGRMNRGIDYRSDFYALGVTLYELLTGQVPFTTDDPMALIHQHMTAQPPLVYQSNPDVPPILSEIIAKLMAKNAEDRYQSALGLKHDLKRCRDEWTTGTTSITFPLAEKDVSDRFLIPEKLYGRSAEVQLLLDAFDRTSQHCSELMLVGGFSGVGKTSVINEVQKPIVQRRGAFISGKFDQFQRNVPYSAVVAAFRQLVQQLLAEDEVKLEQWRDRLSTALEENGQVIIEVISEVELLIGPQPPVPELGPAESQLRFNEVFQKFIRVFCQPDHPLVIFLDDLQWADAGTLKLIELMMTDETLAPLFLIGAYRDNEVSPSHPFIVLVEQLRQSGANVTDILLEPLNLEHLTELVSDTLYCDRTTVTPFAQLVQRKTEGNPFFVNEFLKALHKEDLLYLDEVTRQWQWDLDQIEARGITDDVVELMVGKLRQLEPASQTLLSFGAYIGASFELTTLAIIANQPKKQVHQALQSALQSGFIIPTSTLDPELLIQSYRFGHDRIQQAAYILIPADQSQQTHLKIGRELMQHLTTVEQTERLFELTDHFNEGVSLIHTVEECATVARLNFQSAEKAKSSLAYEAALEYVSAGTDLLTDTLWQQETTLAMKLYRERVDIEYLCGNFESALTWIEAALAKAATDLEKADIYTQQMVLYILSGDYGAGVETTYKAFALLNIEVPLSNPDTEAKRLRQCITDYLQKREIACLKTLPQMTDPAKMLAMKLLDELLPATYVAKPELFEWVISKLVIYSIDYGLHPSSCHGFSCYGMLLVFEETYQDGYAFGNIALELAQEWNEHLQISRTAHVLSAFLMSWVKPVSQSDTIQRLVKSDLTYMGYSYAECFGNKLLEGLTVEALLTETRVIDRDLEKFENKYTEVINAVFRFSLKDLQGTPETLIRCDGKHWEEADFIQECENQQWFAGLCTHYILRSLVHFLSEAYDTAYELTRQAEAHIQTRKAGMIVPVFYLYHCLILAANYGHREQEQEAIMVELTERLEQLAIWGQSCPENFHHLHLLIMAEVARLQGRPWDAMTHYDDAIADARHHGFIHHAAIANERAANFYLETGKEKIAAVYLQTAHYCYEAWGANAKVRDLEQHYASLLQPVLQKSRPSLTLMDTLNAIASPNLSIHSTGSMGSDSSTHVNQVLDFASVLQASQAISEVIQLEDLLHQLTHIILKNSGGDRCVLLLPEQDSTEQGKWQVRAIATTEKTQLVTQPLSGNEQLPVQLIQYVKNTHTVVAIDNLKTDLPFQDDFLVHHQPQSVLCLPILNQGTLVSIVYLQNQSARGVFTSDRILVLNFLCSQAAISLENARLHAQEQEKNHILAQSQQRLQLMIQQTPVVVVEWNTNFEFTSWNPAAEKVFGYSAEESIGAHFRLIVLDEHQAYVDDVANQIMAQQGGSYAVNDNRTKDGRRITCEWFSAPMFDVEGQVCGGVSVGLDVTARKKAEAATLQKSQELEAALTELGQTQLQMVQSEKMSALGNLVAGVAHEINNPLGFVSGNISELKLSLDDIVDCLQAYRDAFPTPGSDIQELLEDTEIDFVLEDLPNMLESMKAGCDRIRGISNSLRIFSRADTESKIKANIHEGIDSTILILKYRLKAKDFRPAIQVICDYGDVPDIDCFPGQLNQVFMNLLANAIDMFDEVAEKQDMATLKANPQTITIQTKRVDEKSVEICIRDNGKGIAEETCSRIFERTFTTKKVGKGTGLGLAIAHQVITEKHGGTLEVCSAIGQGTKFIIQLPLGRSVLAETI